MDDWIDKVWCEDCSDGLARIPRGSIDLVVTDPPYLLGKGDYRGGGVFGTKKRAYREEIVPISKGIGDNILDLLVEKMRAVNIYIWCNKAQLSQYLAYFEGRGCNTDVLAWHKTNPIPTCNNCYLSDTEYVVFARDPGVRLYGSYDTKRKYWVTPTNKADRELYNHPTIKPLQIIETLIGNSSAPNQIVLDPFLGSGTSACAAKALGRHYVGFEMNPMYYSAAVARIDGTKAPQPSPSVKSQKTLESFARCPRGLLYRRAPISYRGGPNGNRDTNHPCDSVRPRLTVSPLPCLVVICNLHARRTNRVMVLSRSS